MSIVQDINTTTANSAPVDYYSKNSDYTGKRNVSGGHEMVEYHENTHHRVWLNEANEDYDAHWHSALEMILPLENIYTVTAHGDTFVIQPGEILIVPPGELHELHAPTSGKRFIYIMNISPLTKLKGFARIASIMSHSLLISESTHPNIYPDVYDLLVQIRNEYFSNHEFAELTIQSLLLNLFVKLGENHSQQENIFTNAKPSKQKEYIQLFNDALEYIDNHYTEDISLDYIAGQTGFSKFHFSRLFKQYTGYNFSDYLCFRRIKEAEKKLENPDYSITDVAISSGFASISTFNRLFKQQKGCTPSEYRKQNSHLVNKHLK